MPQVLDSRAAESSECGQYLGWTQDLRLVRQTPLATEPCPGLPTIHLQFYIFLQDTEGSWSKVEGEKKYWTISTLILFWNSMPYFEA